LAAVDLYSVNTMRCRTISWRGTDYYRADLESWCRKNNFEPFERKCGKAARPS
jgi:hypothetical protein